MNIDFEVINEFKSVGKFANTESINEKQLYQIPEQ